MIGQRASYTAADIENINLLYSYDDSNIDLDNCNCEKVEISGLSRQTGRNGIYTKEAKIIGDRFSFKQQGKENYFYYRGSSSKWYIGSENGSSSRGVEVWVNFTSFKILAGEKISITH